MVIIALPKLSVLILRDPFDSGKLNPNCSTALNNFVIDWEGYNYTI